MSVYIKTNQVRSKREKGVTLDIVAAAVNPKGCGVCLSMHALFRNCTCQIFGS